MATYHLSMQFVSRAKGHSSVAGAAYRSGTKLRDERTGEIHDYTRRQGVIESFVLAPEDAPEWASHREALWNAAEQKENRSNSQTAREFQLALPHELSDRERRDLVREWVTENLTSKGIAADVAIHRGEDKNYHAHVLSTTRPITHDGWGKKIREFTDKVREYRESWAEAVNLSLERAGGKDRVDHRPKIEQYEEAYRRDPLNIPDHLQKAPQVKKGRAVDALMARGEMDHGMVRRYLRSQEAKNQEWDIQTVLVRKEVELERQLQWSEATRTILEKSPEKLPELIDDMNREMVPYVEKEAALYRRIVAETSAALEKKERGLRGKIGEEHDYLSRWRDPKGWRGLLDKTGVGGYRETTRKMEKDLAKHSAMLLATSKEITAIRDWMDGHTVSAADIPTLEKKLAEEPKTEDREAYEWRAEIIGIAQSAMQERQRAIREQERANLQQNLRSQNHERSRDRGRDGR